MKAPSEIKNKIKREIVYQRQKSEKNAAKLKRRQQIKKQEEKDPSLKEQRLKENIPQTLENTREFDETLVDGEDEEVRIDEESDEFASYFNGNPPKILITTSKRPTAAVYEFAQEFISIFPTADFVKRGSQFEVKKIVELAANREYTDLIIIKEDKKEPSLFVLIVAHLTFIHLPEGPTATFRLTSFKSANDIRGHGRVTAHTPELILNNFESRLGHNVGRFFASLFPQVPQFQGRQVVTFHNQRDFIFFRRHRYIFRDGKRCELQELGPRFTLKLRSWQKGTFDTKHGEYEWIFKPDMDVNRRKFHL